MQIFGIHEKEFCIHLAYDFKPNFGGRERNSRRYVCNVFYEWRARALDQSFTHPNCLLWWVPREMTFGYAHFLVGNTTNVWQVNDINEDNSPSLLWTGGRIDPD
jgi:hypothetical protein